MIIHFGLLCTLLLVQQDEPRKRPPILSGEVLVQGRNIRIPPMPGTVQQARAEWSKVFPLLESALGELELDLVKLYGSLSDTSAAPTVISVQASEKETVRIYNRILHDDEYAALETKVIEAWNEWQMTLIKTGLATDAGNKRAEGTWPKPADAELARKVQVMKGSNFIKAYDRKVRWDLATEMPNTPPDIDILETGVYMASFQRGIETSLRLKEVDRAKVPKLAQAWEPLVEHLSLHATQLMDLEKVPPSRKSAGLDLLRLHAKITFLERYRSNLWFCHVAWSRLTSNPPPAPLKNLKP